MAKVASDGIITSLNISRSIMTPVKVLLSRGLFFTLPTREPPRKTGEPSLIPEALEKDTLNV